MDLETKPRTPRPSPWLLFATLGVALYAWMSGARTVDFYRSMPNFSRGDVGRLLFVYGEQERYRFPRAEHARPRCH